MADLKEVAQEVLSHLDTVKTWFSPGSARHRAVSEQADALAEALGGRPAAQADDPSLATPGPGVKSATTPVQVDSVGSVAEAASTVSKVVQPNTQKPQNGSEGPPPAF